jgi:ATP-dependent Zn protease
MTQPYGYQPNSFPTWPPNNQGRTPRKNGFKVIAWLLFVALAVALVFLLNNNAHANYQTIPLSDFYHKLDDNQVDVATIGVDRIFGTLASQNGASVPFEVRLPEGTTSNWNFTQWLLEHAGGASINVDTAPVLLNILLPLIPWLVIFLFIWFFVFRMMRRNASLSRGGLSPNLPAGQPYSAWIYPQAPAIPPSSSQPMPGSTQ